MSRKKQTNFLIGAITLLVLTLGIFFTSNDSSKLVSGFKDQKISSNPTPEVIEEDVIGDLDSISLTPGLSQTPDEEIVDSPAEDLIETQSYKVIKVVDGDTLDVNIDGKVERLRLIGIDTPETVDPRKPVQCFGKDASNKAKELLTGQSVTLEADETQGDRDKYKRLLRYVFLPDGTNFNLYMIAEGYAHEYTYDQPYKYQADFKQAEIDARNNSKGLWNPSTCNGNK